MADTRTLHLYGQCANHEEAWVVGNKAGLKALRDAIDRALTSDQVEGASQYAVDGEGYKVLVLPLSTEGMADLKLPYTDDGFDWKGQHPFEVVKTDRYVELMREREGDDG